MAQKPEKFILGLALEPVSADPANPIEGQLQRSDGTHRAIGLWEYRNAAWARIGSEISDPAIFGKFDAENGDLTDFTGASIDSSTPIAGEQSYTVSLPFSTPDVPVDERRENAFCQTTARVRVTSGSVTAQVKDDSATVLAEVDVDSSNSRVSLQYVIPTGTTDLTFEVIDDSSGTGVTVDDILFSDDPFAYKNLIADQWLRLQGKNGAGSSGTRIPRFTNTLNDTGSDIFEYDDNATNGATFTMNKRAFVSMEWSETTDNEDYIGISLNSASLSTDINSLAAAEILAIGESNALDPTHISWSGTLEEGDVVRFHIGTGGTGGSGFRIGNISAITETENVVRESNGNENTYSAKIASAGTVTSQNENFIQSVSNTATGKYTITLVPGFFTQAPSVVTGYYAPTATAGEITVVSATTSTILIECFNASAAAFANKDFDLVLQRQGTDYRDPTNYVVTPVLNDTVQIRDGITAPATATFAQMYIDTADGDLKIKFADGTVKTIVTDT